MSKNEILERHFSLNVTDVLHIQLVARRVIDFVLVMI